MTLAPQMAPNGYVNERMSALSAKITTSATSWLNHKQQQISDASNRASEFAMPWFVSGKEYVMAGSEKVAEVVAPWYAYGRDKMTEGLKEAHDKARATLLPSTQSVAYNKDFAQIEKPRLMDFSKKVTVLPNPHPKNRLNAKPTTEGLRTSLTDTREKKLSF